MDIIKPKNNNEDVVIDSNYIVDEDTTLYSKLNTIENFTSKCTFYEEYARALFFKIGRVVSLVYQGERKTHSESDEILFTIPDGYRPVGNNAQYYIVGSLDDNVARFYINADGNVKLETTYSSSTTRAYLNVCYPTDE